MALSAGLVAAVGFCCWRLTRIPTRATASQTFVAVAMTWAFASIAGAVPFVLAGAFDTFDDALFESVSGFTGTGATVLDPIEDAPRGILFWRSMTQWYGGTGMVILAVAVLPFLGVGGMDLLRTEAPGPTADRLAPRVSESAKRLFLVYGLFTAVSVALLLGVGMSIFDAVTHAFTVVSTGGLSPYNNSIAAFDSLPVEMAILVLMLIGGASFTLHWRLVTGDPGAYRRSPMLRFYLGVFVLFTALVTLVLVVQDGQSIGGGLRGASFNVATLLTSTGFGTADYVLWAPGAQLLLFALMISGGMAGSTAGGMKLIRVRVLLRHALREVQRIRRPRAVLLITFGRESIPERIVARIIGFSITYVLIILVSTVVLGFLGTGLAESAGAAASAMGNMGPAFGDAGPASNYLVYGRPARGLIMVLMLAGRLEIFPVAFALAQFASLRRVTRSLPVVSR